MIYHSKKAMLSDTGIYRYWLTRDWDEAKPATVFIMLNPSTADASEDDPTIRRCVRFADAWGSGGVCVVNLFAFRSPDPSHLRDNPIYVSEPGDLERNDREIYVACRGRARERQYVIAAWGACHIAKRRAGEVSSRLRSLGIPLHCLGVTQSGCPKHPLYLPSSATPMLFEG